VRNRHLNRQLIAPTNFVSRVNKALCTLAIVLVFSNVSHHGQLVLLVGAKLQHVIATLALETAGLTGHSVGAKLKPRDDLFWFKKPELMLSLIHFVLFQVSNAHRDQLLKLKW